MCASSTQAFQYLLTGIQTIEYSYINNTLRALRWYFKTSTLLNLRWTSEPRGIAIRSLFRGPKAMLRAPCSCQHLDIIMCYYEALHLSQILMKIVLTWIFKRPHWNPSLPWLAFKFREGADYFCIYWIVPHSFQVVLACLSIGFAVSLLCNKIVCCLFVPLCVPFPIWFLPSYLLDLVLGVSACLWLITCRCTESSLSTAILLGENTCTVVPLSFYVCTSVCYSIYGFSYPTSLY